MSSGAPLPKSLHVSGRFLRVAQPTGTQRSAQRLLAAILPHLADHDVVVHAPDGQTVAGTGGRVKVAKIPGSSARYDHLWEQLVLPLKARPGGVILTLMGTGPVWHPGSPHVMVVHDLNFLILPDNYTRVFRWWYHYASALAARRADLIVCFSGYVRDTLVRLLRVPAERIRVIPQGPGLSGIEQASALPAAATPDAPYFLCVGSLQPHKNLGGVLRAWRHFSARHPGHRLKIVGRKQARFTGLPFDAADLDLPGVEFTGYVSDEQLIALYRGATGFLYPSIEEGFGLPVVEAFYCGCPVVTSNRSCLPEVAGNAALLIDPLQPDELAAAMELLVRDPGERQRLAEAGRARAGHYRWETAGVLMAGVLREVISSP